MAFVWSRDMGASSRSQQLETDLKIEREWRQTLQSDLDRERGTVAQLSTEALQIKMLKQVKPESTVLLHDVPSLGFIGYDFNQTPRLFDFCHRRSSIVCRMRTFS